MTHLATQEEAAEAYDVAAIKFRGLSAITNFEMNRYNTKRILDGAELPIGHSEYPLKQASHNSTLMSTIAFHQKSPFNKPYPYYNSHPAHIFHDLNSFPSCSTSLELGMFTNFDANINQGKQMETDNTLGCSDLYRSAYYNQATDMHNPLTAPTVPVFTVWDR